MKKTPAETAKWKATCDRMAAEAMGKKPPRRPRTIHPLTTECYREVFALVEKYGTEMVSTAMSTVPFKAPKETPK